MPEYLIELSNSEPPTKRIFTDNIYWKSDEVFRINENASHGFIIQYDELCRPRIHYAVNGVGIPDENTYNGYSEISVFGSLDNRNFNILLYKYSATDRLRIRRKIEKPWFNEIYRCTKCYTQKYASKRQWTCKCEQPDLELIIDDRKFFKIRNRAEKIENQSLWLSKISYQEKEGF